MIITNSSVSVPPPWCEAGKEKVYAYSQRPDGGGPICWIVFRAGDHRWLASFDARTLPNFGDTALAAPFVSNYTGTIKAFVSYIPDWGGNDRCIEVIDTGVVPEVAAMEPQTLYKTASGEPTAKWAASAKAGGVSAAVVTLVAFLVAQLLPAVPEQVQSAVVVLVVAASASLATLGPALLAAWLKRPEWGDRIVEDKPVRQVEPIELAPPPS